MTVELQFQAAERKAPKGLPAVDPFTTLRRNPTRSSDSRLRQCRDFRLAHGRCAGFAFMDTDAIERSCDCQFP